MSAGTALGGGALLLAAFLAPAAPAQVKATAPGTPTMRATVDTTATTVGGRLRLTLDVETPEGFLVTIPEQPPDLGPFRVRSMAETERSATRRRLVLTLIATEAGESEIPPVTLQVTHGSDPEGMQIASDPIPVSVRSNLSAEELAALGAASGPPMGQTAPGAPPGASGQANPGESPGPEPAALKPPLGAPRRWLPVILAGALAALLGIAAFLAIRAWRARALPDSVAETAPAAPRRPPWEVALEQLDAIAEAGWVDRGMAERQYEEVTWTLRRYLEDRYGVPALERTTDDLRDLLRHAPIRGDLSTRVLSLLGEADLVKFARAVPDPTGARASERHAREIVQRTMPVREDREEAA